MKKERFVSLKVKMSIGVVVICLLIGLLSILSVRTIAENIVDKEYRDKAEQVAQAVAQTLDPADVQEMTDAVMDVYFSMDRSEVIPSSEWGSDAWNAYMAKYEDLQSLPVFIKLRDHFRVYQDIFKVDCIYIVNHRKADKHGIYIVDGAPDEDACPPGCVDSFEDGIWPEETDEVIPATITNEGVYGWLVTAGYIVKSNDGKFLGHVCVDVSMNDIKAKERSYVITISLVMVGLTILVLILALWFVNRYVTKPVSILSDTAKNYVSENNDVEHHAFEKLEFKTHDEIGGLLASMKQMEADMNSNIHTLLDTKVALRQTEEKASTMQALAVKDALTGVRNKTAYDFEVQKLEADLANGFIGFGLAMVDLNFLKKTNDTYGHEKGNVSIKKLCMLICEVFEHSPVFRVGGDEFVVILKNRDFRDIDSLLEEFEEHLTQMQNDDSLKPWEKISAAIGYAKYDKSVDKTVEDVFKRADKTMYERKVAMKAQRQD